MKKLKTFSGGLLCGLLFGLSSFCLFACDCDEPRGPDTTDPTVWIEYKSGVSEFSVEHHGRTVNGDVYIPDTEFFSSLVIFSHGYNGCKDDFKPTAEYLMNHGIASITFTFCGSGARDQSGFPTTDMTLFTEREDLYAVIDYANRINHFRGDLFLFGGSQGGMVSALAAEERVTRIAGLIMLYPALCIPDYWNNAFPNEEEIPETYPVMGVTLGKKFFTSVRTLDVYEKMHEFTKPVLLMHGENDDLVPVGYSERAAASYPHAKFIKYSGGHGDTPPNMNDLVLDFVRNGH